MQRRAQAKAAELGISFAEYVRRASRRNSGEPQPKPDISVLFDLGASDEPTNIARDKDKMIGEALWKEYQRKTAHMPEAQGEARTEPALTIFVDTSVLFAAANIRDQHNGRAKTILAGATTPVLTDHVLVETWRLLRDRIHGRAAEQFWYGLRRGAARIENTITSDLERAWDRRSISRPGVLHRRPHKLRRDGAARYHPSGELRRTLRDLPLRPRSHKAFEIVR